MFKRLMLLSNRNDCIICHHDPHFPLGLAAILGLLEGEANFPSKNTRMNVIPVTVQKYLGVAWSSIGD